MMQKQYNLKNSLQLEQGFTLVELMVVVAIIGILSSVAVPNFKRYQAQSKTAEAKLQLSALYSAETSAFAEYGTYVTCLGGIGYDSSAEAASRYYAIGFGALSDTANGNARTNGLAAASCADSGTFWSSGAVAANHFGYGANKKMGNANASGFAWYAASATTVPASGSTFIAAAGGPIHPDFAATGTGDVWQITEGKVLTQVRRGY